MTDSMYSILVAINVKPEYRDSFIKAGIAEAQGSVSGEPEIFQFQMLVDETNPNRFYFLRYLETKKQINLIGKQMSLRPGGTRSKKFLMVKPSASALCAQFSLASPAWRNKNQG